MSFSCPMARSCRFCRISSHIRPCALPPSPTRQTSLSDRKNIGLRDRALSRNLRPVPSATETPANTVAAHDPCYGAPGLAIQNRAPRTEGELPALLAKRKPPVGKIPTHERVGEAARREKKW